MRTNPVQHSTSSLLSAVALCATLLPNTSSACSKSPVHIQRWTTSTVLFLGNATTDTMLAGPGSIKYDVAAGHFGPAGERTIYGQVIEVERLPSRDRELLPRGVQRVLLVPWDYGADCRPTPWMQTARWIPPGTRGIYNASLRERSAWVNGMPTLDMMSPGNAPYTGSARGFMRHDSTMLSVEELFPLIEFMPDPAVMDTNPERAIQPLLEWARANRGMLERGPIRELLLGIGAVLRNHQFSRIESPLLGTYRFTLTIPGHKERVFFGRTGPAPNHNWYWYSRQPRVLNYDPTVMDSVTGYYLLITLTGTASELSDRCGKVVAYLAADVMHVDSSNVRVWPGLVEWELLHSMFPGDTVLAPYAASWTGGFAKRLRAEDQAPARFTMTREGQLHLRAEFPLDENRRLVLRGERVSNAVTRCGAR